MKIGKISGLLTILIVELKKQCVIHNSFIKTGLIVYIGSCQNVLNAEYYLDFY